MSLPVVHIYVCVICTISVLFFMLKIFIVWVVLSILIP